MIRLRELREQSGYSVKEMCTKLGVDDSRYRKWESGTNGLPSDFAMMCCDIFRCSMDELAGRTPLSMSADERRLLDLFRSCSPAGREYMLGIAETTARLFPKES